jgi:hypothetical protein
VLFPLLPRSTQNFLRAGTTTWRFQKIIEKLLPQDPRSTAQRLKSVIASSLNPWIGCLAEQSCLRSLQSFAGSPPSTGLVPFRVSDFSSEAASCFQAPCSAWLLSHPHH